MARAGFVDAGENHVDHGELSRGGNALGGKARPGVDDAITGCCMLQRSNNCRADRNDAPALRTRDGNRLRSGRRDFIRFLEWQPLVELGIAGRRDASCVRDGDEVNIASAQCHEQSPVEGEAGRWRFERHGRAYWMGRP